MNKSKELLKSLNFCVIDLETTGGNHESDQIIEVGLVRIRNLEIVSSKNYLVNPEKQIPEFIQKLTSIKQEDVAGCPTINTIIDEVQEYIGDDIIVAHNTSFDVPFLNSVMRRLKRPEFKNRVICTNVMTKHMIPEIMTSNLNYMSQLFNIDHTNAHRAKDDAIATAKLLLKFLEIFESKGIKKINQLYYPRNKFELDRVHIKNKKSSDDVMKIILTQNTPMALSFKGERGIILTVLPIESPKEEAAFIEETLKNLDWDILTIKLICPLLEGFFQFNNHLQKYSEQNKERVLTYLTNRYAHKCKDPIKLADLDFIIGHHLVQSQVTAYNFLHLNTNTKHLFKIPAQKKKMLNYMQAQIKRFKNNQKKQKRTILHEELSAIVESYITDQIRKGEFLNVTLNNLKESESSILRKVEEFTSTRPRDIHFPQSHL